MRYLTFGLLVGLLAPGWVAAQIPPATEAWRHTFAQPIAWQQMTPLGILLVQTGNDLTALQPESGEVLWQTTYPAPLAPTDVAFVPNSTLVKISHGQSFEVLDPATKTVILNTETVGLASIISLRTLPLSGGLLVQGKDDKGTQTLVLCDLQTGAISWRNTSLFQVESPSNRGGLLGAMMSSLATAASNTAQDLTVLEASPELLVVHAAAGLIGLHARTGEQVWKTPLANSAMATSSSASVRLFPSLREADRFYCATGPMLMPYSLATGTPLWSQPPKIAGEVAGIVQHAQGLVLLTAVAAGGQSPMLGPQSTPPSPNTTSHVVRYADGSTVNSKPIRIRGELKRGLVAGNDLVLEMDAERKTFVNVLDMATGNLRLKKDVKIKGQLDFVELVPSGLLFISRPDPTTNAEVNIVDLTTGELRFRDPIESGKPLDQSAFKEDKFKLLFVDRGADLLVFANRDSKLYSVDKAAASYRELSPEIKFEGGDYPNTLEVRPEGIFLGASQSAVLLVDGAIQYQVYHPAPRLPGLMRALLAVQSVRAGLNSAVYSAYGAQFTAAAQQQSNPGSAAFASELGSAFSAAGDQLQGISRQGMALALKRFKASQPTPSKLFFLTQTKAGNFLLQVDKANGTTVAGVDLGKEREPVYAVDDITNMVFLQGKADELIGYRF